MDTAVWTWRLAVKVTNYFIACFDHIIAFWSRTSIKGRAHTCCIDLHLCSTHEPRPWQKFYTTVLRMPLLNQIMQRTNIQFLPETATCSVHVPVFTHTCNGVYIMYIQCRYTLCTCVAACTCMFTVHHNNRCDSLIVHVLFIGWIVSQFVSVKHWRRRKRRGRRRIRNRKSWGRASQREWGGGEGEDGRRVGRREG